MVKNFNFKEIECDFDYALAPHTKAKAKFSEREDGSLVNEYNDAIKGYDYISLISKEEYSIGAQIDVDCYFEGTGAPCIVFTDDLRKKDGTYEYGDHFEVCIYEGGLNVWYIIPWPERVARPIKPTLLLEEKWKVCQSGVNCKVKFDKKRITVQIEGRELVVENENMPEKFKIGFTACEGFCGFKSFSVES